MTESSDEEPNVTIVDGVIHIKKLESGESVSMPLILGSTGTLSFLETEEDDERFEEIRTEALRRFTIGMSFNAVDPDVLGLLTGGVMGNPVGPTVSLETYTPARRRTLWEWLRRRPKHYAAYTFIPHARVTEVTEHD